MPVISNTDLQVITDKLARWAAMSVGDATFSGAFNAGMEAANAAVMSGASSLQAYIFGTITDSDVAADMLNAARNLDESNPTPPSRFLLGIAGVSSFLSAIDTHIKRYTAYSTLDAYLTNLNASTPTLRVHQSLHDHIKPFARKNVFIGADLVLATFTATGATAGTFVHVTTVGTSYAGAQLKVKNQGAVTTGATLSVTGKKIDGTTSVITATIATGTDAFETALSVTSKLFVEVTAITIAGATSGNVYKIVAKTDRDISAA